MKKEKSFLSKNWLLLFAIAYLILPIDLIPDAIPLIGLIDDVLIMILELYRRYDAHKKTGQELSRSEKDTFSEE